MQFYLQKSFLLILLTLISPTSSLCQSNSSYVVIENNGFTMQFKTVPRRVITMNQTQTEIMLALGLEDHMVGTAYIDDEIIPKFKKAYAKIPVLSKKYPSKEIIVSVSPDFIYAGYPSAFSEKRGLPTRPELLSMGINSYLAPISCKGEVTSESPWSMEILYKEIREIGKIFQINNRAAKLVVSMKEDIRKIHASSVPESDKPWVLWLDYFSDKGPYVGSGSGPINAIIVLAGGKNCFNDTLIGKTLVTVSQEQIVSRPIDYIALTEAVWSPADLKIKKLESDAVYAQLEAIRKRKYVPIEFSASTGGIRTVIAIKKLASVLQDSDINE